MNKVSLVFKRAFFFFNKKTQPIPSGTIKL